MYGTAQLYGHHSSNLLVALQMLHPDPGKACGFEQWHHGLAAMGLQIKILQDSPMTEKGKCFRHCIKFGMLNLPKMS